MNPLTTRRGWQATGFRSSRLAGSDPSHTSIRATVIPGDESRRSRRDLIVSATDRSRLERGVAPTPHASPRWPVFVSGSMPGPDFRLRAAVRHAGVRSPLPHRLADDPKRELELARVAPPRSLCCVGTEASSTDRRASRGLNENAPVPAGYQAGLGARSREERYCAPDCDSRTARSQRPIMPFFHKQGF